MLDAWRIQIDAFKFYLQLERSLSENSVQAYLQDVSKLATLPSVISDNIGPTQIQKDHIDALLLFIHDIGMGEKSQARIISGLRAFFRFLLLENQIELNPMDLIEGPKLSKKIPSVLDHAEIQAMFQAIDMSEKNGHRNRAILETLYACGLRVSELVNLKLSNYYRDIEFVKVIGKGDKERIVPIGGEAMKFIDLYVNKVRKLNRIAPGYEDFIFLNRSGKSLSRVMIFTMIKKIAEAAGIEKNVSPHTFRHSFATHLVEGGANLRAVQDMLGHESITTTEIYAHMDSQYLRDTILSYHPRSTK